MVCDGCPQSASHTIFARRVSPGARSICGPDACTTLTVFDRRFITSRKRHEQRRTNGSWVAIDKEV